MNESGLEPRGHCVLVEAYEPERKKGLIELPPSVHQTELMLEMRARVIAVGPHCWKDEPEPRAKPGDIVMIAKMSGALMKGPKDGKLYRAINGRDIFVRVTHVEGD